MRFRSFKSGYDLETAVIRFSNNFRNAGEKMAVRFDGEWLKRRSVDRIEPDDAFFIGVYDPLSETFDFEAMVADILSAMDDMGVMV